MRVTRLVAAALVLAACAPKPETPEQTAARLKAESDTARVAIEAQDARVVRYLAAAQADSLVSMYAEDAVVYWMGTPELKGRAAMASRLRTMFSAGSYAYKATTFSVEASGPIAIETARTEATFTPGPGAPRGTKASNSSWGDVTIWRKTGGQWLIARDFLLTSVEPEQPTPAKRN